MVLTRRAAKSILTWLPNEIIAEIIRILPTGDQAALCLASKLFNALVTHSLYRTIILNSMFQAKPCCLTLTNNPAKAASVRTLYVAHFPEFLPRWSELLNNAIQSLVHVEELKLRLRSKSYRDTLGASSFPRLRIFSLTLSVVSDGLLLPSFLNRHPSIVKLKLYRDSCYPRVPSISVRLPNLHCFRGPSSFFTSIVPQAPLSTAYLSWNIGEDFGPTIAVLEGYSKESLVKLSCIRRGCNADLIEYISRHIPDIQSLHIQSPGGGTDPGDRTTLDAIGISLSNFTALKHLEYCFSLKTPNKMADNATVAAWGRACPTLRKIDFYGLTWKLRFNTWNSSHSSRGFED